LKILTLWAEATVKPPVVLLALIAILMIGASDVLAYDDYAGGCDNCHGGFLDSPYTSASDGANWGDSLHNVHLSMVSSDCNVCHTGTPGDNDVFLESSTGGSGGMAAIGCVGCHGRDEDITATSQRGAGLRQHHVGVVTCGGCHSDQTGYITVDENVLPNYYANPGTGHPAIPSNSCNPAATTFVENFAGTTLGLDNDGDSPASVGSSNYDMGDPDCEGFPVELMTFEIE